VFFTDGTSISFGWAVCSVILLVISCQSGGGILGIQSPCPTDIEIL